MIQTVPLLRFFFLSYGMTLQIPPEAVLEVPLDQRVVQQLPPRAWVARPQGSSYHDDSAASHAAKPIAQRFLQVLIGNVQKSNVALECSSGLRLNVD